MENPILVEVTRGNLVESVHRGALAVAKADGTLLCSLGRVDHNAPVLRHTNKVSYEPGPFASYIFKYRSRSAYTDETIVFF